MHLAIFVKGVWKNQTMHLLNPLAYSAARDDGKIFIGENIYTHHKFSDNTTVEHVQ